MANQINFEKLTKDQIQALIYACEFYYPQISSGKGYPRIEGGDYGVPSIAGAKWSNYTEFDQWIGGAIRTYTFLQKRLAELSGSAPAPSPNEQPSATTPDKIELDKLVEDYEKAETEAQKEKVLAANKKIKFVREFTKVDKIRPEDFKNRIIYAEPTKEAGSTSLSETERIAYEKLKEAVQNDPKTFIEKTASEISRNIPQKVAGLSGEEVALSSKMVASDLAARLILKTPVIPSEVFSALSTSDKFLAEAIKNAELARLIKEGSVVFASVGKANEINIRSFLVPSYGNNFVDFIYGKEGSAFSFSTAPTEKTAFEIDLQKFGQSFQSFQESDVFKLITSPVSDSLKTKISSEGQRALNSFFSSLPKGSFLAKLSSSSLTSQGIGLLSGFKGQYVASGAFGSFIKTAFPEYLPLLHSLTGWLGLDIGISATGALSAPVAGAGLESATFSVGFAKAIGLGAGKIVGGAVAKVAGAVIGDAAGAALGAEVGTVVAPIIGTAVGAILGFVGGKALSKVLAWAEEKIGKYKDFFLGLFALGVVGLGAVLGSTVLMVVGGIGFFFVALGFLGVAPVALLAAGGGAVLSLFSQVLGATLVSISALVLVIIISVPILIAIILFIINSGAYIVPPKTGSVPGAIESPYIGIEKTANPKVLANLTGEETIVYSVKIFAKKGTLSSVQIKNEYKVVSKSSPPAPSPDVEEINSPPKIISPASPYAFSYSIKLGPQYNDSVVVDSLSVTADAPDQKGASAKKSASVTIGNPPLNCPLPDGDAFYFSYSPGDETTGHGSNAYWQGRAACSYNLPQTVCRGPNSPLAKNNVCYDPVNGCDFYGYALDVRPTSTDEVFAPTIEGKSVVWKRNGGFTNPSNGGYTAIYESGPYHLVLTHVDSNSSTGQNIPSGEKIGRIYPAMDHVHIEFAKNGRYQKPEDFFCF